MRLLIEQKGANPDAPPCSVNHWSVLMNAAASGNVDVVQEILKHHPDVNAKFGNSQAPLAFGLQRGTTGPNTTKIVRLLIAAGADVNSRDDSGRTPIFYACYHGPEAVRALIQAGTNVNAQDHFGQTALLSCYDRAARRALIEAGATPSPRIRRAPNVPSPAAPLSPPPSTPATRPSATLPASAARASLVPASAPCSLPLPACAAPAGSAPL